MRINAVIGSVTLALTATVLAACGSSTAARAPRAATATS